MKRLALVVVLSLGLTASAFADPITKDNLPDLARQQTEQTLGLMLTPKADKQVPARFSRCSKTQCHFTMRGTSVCRGVVQMRLRHGVGAVWFSRLRCG